MTLPDALLERIERLIHGHPELGYSTVTEYIRAALRRALPEDEARVAKR